MHNKVYNFIQRTNESINPMREVLSGRVIIIIASP
jgi:hypothetical protein